MDNNTVIAPPATGTPFDLTDVENESNPTTTSQAEFVFILGEDRRSEVALVFNPIEFRDLITFSGPVRFGGTLFPASTLTQTQFRLYEFDARYEYLFVRSPKWTVQAGGGITIQDLKIGLDNGTQFQTVSDLAVFPIVSGLASYRLARKWRLDLDANFAYLDTDKQLSAGVFVKYLLNPHWEFGIGWRYFDREIDTDDLFNEYTFNAVLISTQYAW